MDCEERRTLSELADKAFKIFAEFMTRVTQFEELVPVGSKLLVGYHQELGLLRGPPLHKTSKVVEGIIEANQTERMKVYVEAGCRHVHDAAQNMTKLFRYHQGLQDYLSKVKVLLDELECLRRDILDVTPTVKGHIEELSNNLSEDIRMHEANYFEKDDTGTYRFQCLEISDYAVMMGVIHKMIKLDYTMQEKIILSLNINASSDELNSYCSMWDLRPFVNEGIMRQAWRFIP